MHESVGLIFFICALAVVVFAACVGFLLGWRAERKREKQREEEWWAQEQERRARGEYPLRLQRE